MWCCTRKKLPYFRLIKWGRVGIHGYGVTNIINENGPSSDFTAVVRDKEAMIYPWDWNRDGTRHAALSQKIILDILKKGRLSHDTLVLIGNGLKSMLQVPTFLREKYNLEIGETTSILEKANEYRIQNKTFVMIIHTTC